MQFFSLASLLSLALSLAAVCANTPLSDDQVNASLANNNGLDIAMAARPLWHFGRREGLTPCYPSPAFINGQQHGTSPPEWPFSQGDCAGPGIPAGQSEFSNPFPNYYTVDKCGDDELRVVYSIYYSHDGHHTSVAVSWTGHMHDWERVVVKWRRDPGSGEWRRATLFLGYHSGYVERGWDRVQNTFDYADISEQGGKDKDGAKIYVGASKHANFDTRNTGWNDPGSQGCPREFRSRDWYYMADEANLVPAGAGTPEGNAIDAADWGKATTDPVEAQRGVCDIKDGGWTTC